MRRREWFQVVICVGIIPYGMGLLLNVHQSDRTALGILPVAIRYVFAAWALAAVIIVLWGMFQRSASGLLAERAGLLMLGSLELMYAVLVISLLHEGVLGTIFFPLLVAVASYLRGWDITVARREATKHGG